MVFNKQVISEMTIISAYNIRKPTKNPAVYKSLKLK